MKYIFKSELQHDFLEFKKGDDILEIIVRQGININKLDKGCLVFNTNTEEGYKVLSIDNNRYDAKYWLEDFLGIEPLADENFYTKNYLKFCQNFAKDVVLPAEDKQQEVLFMNRAVNHFAKNDAFEESSFLNEVMENPELIPEFKHYKVEKGPKLSELGAMNALTLEKYLKKIHPSHIEKIVQITYEVIQKKQALQISINSGMIVNALKMLNHLNTTSKTYSIERQNLQSKLQKILESSTEQD